MLCKKISLFILAWVQENARLLLYVKNIKEYIIRIQILFAVAEISEANMASDIGKIETKAQFLAMKPEGVAGVLATAIKYFKRY